MIKSLRLKVINNYQQLAKKNVDNYALQEGGLVLF
tara:strand:- start:455 stop:559 length:105 start_codon:yes stop_codon:yes gene_type:complete